MTSRGVTECAYTISRTISEIGEKAGVVVNVDPKTGGKKYASAHDLRRAFGTRWAPLVQPAVLQLMMRHASIQTTMKFYVELRATEIGDMIWNAAGAGQGATQGATRRRRLPAKQRNTKRSTAKRGVS